MGEGDCCSSGKGGFFMNIKVTGKNIDVTGAMREYIEKRMERLEKFSNDNTDVNVVCSVEREEQIVEIQISNGSDFVRVEEKNEDLYASIDLAIDRAERQLRKEKEKRVEKHQGASLRGRYEEVAKENVAAEDEVTNTVYYELKPLSIEDAKIRLSASEDLFFTFVNAETSKVNVLYKRAAGTFGIVIPE